MLDKGKSRLCLLYQHKERNTGTERSPTAPGGLSPSIPRLHSHPQGSNCNVATAMLNKAMQSWQGKKVSK